MILNGYSGLNWTFEAFPKASFLTSLIFLYVMVHLRFACFVNPAILVLRKSPTKALSVRLRNWVLELVYMTVDAFSINHEPRVAHCSYFCLEQFRWFAGTDSDSSI